MRLFDSLPMHAVERSSSFFATKTLTRLDLRSNGHSWSRKHSFFSFFPFSQEFLWCGPTLPSAHDRSSCDHTARISLGTFVDASFVLFLRFPFSQKIAEGESGIPKGGKRQGRQGTKRLGLGRKTEEEGKDRAAGLISSHRSFYIHLSLFLV